MLSVLVEGEGPFCVLIGGDKGYKEEIFIDEATNSIEVSVPEEGDYKLLGVSDQVSRLTLLSFLLCLPSDR